MYDLDLVLIFGFIIVVTTILGISINAVVSKILAHKRWERQDKRDSNAANSAGTTIAERTEIIEDRLRVLERLATDRGQLLADEIEALRDERAAASRLEDVEQ